MRRLALALLAAVVLLALVLGLTRRHVPPVTVWRGRVKAVVSLQSSRPLPVVLEDDKLSLFSPPAQRRAFLDTLRWLGVSVLRISSDWSVQAPDPNGTRPPRGFDGADPAAYSPSAMAPLDGAVRAASAAGLTVDIDVGFYAPRWATRSAAAGGAGATYHSHVDARLFADYARMLATRYDGRYRPPGAAQPLPRVSMFEIWNEPNLAWDFTPQKLGGRPVSPDLYRDLVQAGYPAIKRVDPGATVLVGNTSSTGDGSGVVPLTFVERLACADARLVPLRSGGCAHFRRLPGDGFAHHPYAYSQTPWTQSADPLDAQIGDLPRLQWLLDKLVQMGRLAPGLARLWLTEYGYQSNDQLPEISHWNESQQARFLAIGAYETWLDPQAASFSQFLLRDTEVDAARKAIAARGPHAALPAGVWTTGVDRQDGHAKPAEGMLRTPVVARVLGAGAGCHALEVWSHLQPATRAGVVADVQFAQARGGFESVAQLATGSDGVLDAVLRFSGPEPARVRVQFADGTRQALSPAAAPLRLGRQGLPYGIPARVACGGGSLSRSVR